jgi:hypothetical protein
MAAVSNTERAFWKVISNKDIRRLKDTAYKDWWGKAADSL